MQSVISINSGWRHSFKDRLMEGVPKGANLNLCLTCGLCASGCPAAGLDNMDPRKFVRMAALGLDEELTAHPWVWMCSMCKRCTHVCPMGIDIAAMVYEGRKLWPRDMRPSGIRRSCDMALKNQSCSAMGTPETDFRFVVEDVLEEVRETQPGWETLQAPIDKQGAHFFLSQNSREPVTEPEEMVPLWKILHLWTLIALSLDILAENGVRFIRSRIHTIEPMSDDSLRLRYITESGELLEEMFDMVVLSVGLSPVAEGIELAGRLGIELNAHGFAKTTDLLPVTTSREGIYVCGAFQGPKDIPQSVPEASAAAAEASRSLAGARASRVRSRQLPPERDVSGDPPRIGVFVCHCGINIGAVADVPAIRDYAATLPHVVHVEDDLFTCSQDSQDRMKQILVEHDINRVVVASCSPRTHEPLFQETIREAGLNPYLFEMANIRDPNIWVHMGQPEVATHKARDLVRMAVAKAARLEPLRQVSLGIVPAVLVIGGGVAGNE